MQRLPVFLLVIYIVQITAPENLFVMKVNPEFVLSILQHECDIRIIF